MTEFDRQFEDSSQPGPTPQGGDIAIVGMGCLFAGAPDLDTYWRNIVSKVDAVSDPPADEWDPKVFYDPESQSNDRVYCKRGGYIGELSQFRPMDFGIMPVTVDGGEPDQWLALRVAHEALADAGYLESRDRHLRTEVILGKGTYVNRGNLTVGYHGMIVEFFLQALRNLHPEYTEAEIREIKDELKAGLPPFSADTAPALIGNIIAGRIANRLDFMGPSFTVDAACASALLAIEIGVSDLMSRKCDMVLAGGANVNAPLPTLSLFCQLGALSRREKIRPFDKSADGTILGEGVGMIVLKRREDAERNGDRIYALIKGVGVASDGRALHVMAPRVEGEELALRRAYRAAGVSPETVGLIEAHGTATPVGDVVEVQALSRVFGPRQGSLPSCALGSVKSMIGHTMPAAGIAGTIKAALSLYHRVLPPTLHCEEPNPALHLEDTPFYVNTEARPWIHGAVTPRRAGVNSFGFGGINAHLVLEEYPVEKLDSRSHQLQWETEVCILGGDSRNGLIERGRMLADYLARPGDAPLKDIASTLNGGIEGQPSRLAIVASSREDLAQKLALAIERLKDPKCRQIKDNAGIYFFDKPLGGKIAFLFPGEGAQYPNMLLDLCLHFPEVRGCFDLADRALTHASRSILPSDFIFPRTILSESEKKEVKNALWQIDGAVEAVLIGNWAMWTLLSHLQIRPDAIVGHSTGDYSAMVASSIIGIDDHGYVETILEWNKAHRRLEKQIPVPEATLIAVAADAATVMPIVESIGGEIYLAMDNCPHQSVLVASKAAAEQVIEKLRSRGMIYEILPFDRPYHTPMFQAYAEGAGEEFFARLPISAPKNIVYSCTTADRYPNDVEEIRKLFVAHWVRPVLFTDTVRKLYDDGVRIFVEAGPRGNLTAFVSDILRSRQHLAMPANVARRSGITQMNHLLGALAAQGVGMCLDYLYARRAPQIVPWESTSPRPPERPQPTPMKLTLALPPLKLSPRKPKPAVPSREDLAASSRNGRGNHDSIHETPALSQPVLTQPIIPQPVLPDPVLPEPVRAPVNASASPEAMQMYFRSMETFLDVETQVMEAFLHRTKSGTKPAKSALSRSFPLLGTITSMLPMQELTAVRQLGQEQDLFLRDHALGGAVALTVPELRPLIVLPLTMSMEILAEAASALLPGKVLVGMRDVQARHWIQVDDAPVNLRISARCVAGSPNEVSAQVRVENGATPVVEGIMVFGEDYPAAPMASSSGGNAERISRLASAELYDGRLMFHGPCFQGVEGIDRSGPNGVVAKLRVLPAGSLFRSDANPRFVTDPVALDAAGQLVGFWAAEYLQRGFVVFPYQLARLRIYGPNRAAGVSLTGSVSLQLQGNEGIVSDIEIAGADGTVWMRMEGWADRRFDPPPRFHRAWTAPRETMMSEPWKTSAESFTNHAEFECCRLESVFEPGTGLWKELWASLVLTCQERKVFAAIKGTEQGQLEWLSGRTVLKDAVRRFLFTRHGLELLPADIEITENAEGQFAAAGQWQQHLRVALQLALAQTSGISVALAGPGGNGRSVAIDIQLMRDDLDGGSASVFTGDFTGDEQRLLNNIPPLATPEWLTRLRCAKKAASRVLDRVRITSCDLPTGAIGVMSDATGETLVACTARDGAYVAATAIYERGHHDDSQPGRYFDGCTQTAQ
jgi:acyl transferase domain-containing protein